MNSQYKYFAPHTEFIIIMVLRTVAQHHMPHVCLQCGTGSETSQVGAAAAAAAAAAAEAVVVVEVLRPTRAALRAVALA